MPWNTCSVSGSYYRCCGVVILSNHTAGSKIDMSSVVSTTWAFPHPHCLQVWKEFDLPQW